jgi:hypothetical protein
MPYADHYILAPAPPKRTPQKRSWETLAKLARGVGDGDGRGTVNTRHPSPLWPHVPNAPPCQSP